MCFNFFRRKINFETKSIYWDTNCYRLLGRIANRKGTVWLEDFLRRLKKAENDKGLNIKVSYLVLAEMFAHLNEPIDSDAYLECKHGLFSALFHSNYDVSNLMHNSENLFIEFIVGKAPIADVHREESLYNTLLQINNQHFNDQLITMNQNIVKVTSDYLQNLKDSWKNSFITGFIRKHDPSYTGNWTVFFNNKPKRKQLLQELRKAKKNNFILAESAKGLYQFVANNVSNVSLPKFDVVLANTIIHRFKPLFDLQYRILEFMCQSGYNLDTHQNDITDYLILANLEMGQSLFISNESRNLVPNLHSLGYKSDVLLFDLYCSELSISYK